MSQNTDRSGTFLGGLRCVGVGAVVLVMGSIALTGCSAISAVRKVEHDVTGNKATIDNFTNTIKSGSGVTFEATYVTTGSSPATVLYAVQSPQGLAFQDTPSGATGPNTDIIVNSSGEYSCSPRTASRVTCQKLGTVDAASENQILDLYTPSHWTSFLKDFSIAAGLAGDKVTTSSMTVNGFSMQCVDFNASGVVGTSTICSTAQGILGYVNVASDSTSFEIKSYSPSPPASLFELPAGATITTTPTTPSTTQ
jgi:hypothetical protein